MVFLQFTPVYILYIMIKISGYRLMVLDMKTKIIYSNYLKNSCIKIALTIYSFFIHKRLKLETLIGTNKGNSPCNDRRTLCHTQNKFYNKYNKYFG